MFCEISFFHKSVYRIFFLLVIWARSRPFFICWLNVSIRMFIPPMDQISNKILYKVFSGSKIIAIPIPMRHAR